MLDTATILPLSSRLKKLYFDACRSVCLEFDLTQTDFDILYVLSSEKECDTSAEIAKRRMIKKANVCTSVERLISKNYVVRIPDHKDKRVLHLKLTEKADIPILKIKKVHNDLSHKLSSFLSGDEFNTLTSLLEKLVLSCNACLEGEP